MWNKDFSHIYVEHGALNYPAAQRILNKYADSEIIEISHYKDVFCRPRQDNVIQKMSPKLILAVKKEGYVYEGSRMCDDFGNENFYYTSSVMNCIYNCEYCYLQGMYPSANIVVFVNLEDTFKSVSDLLSLKKSLYLCVSYDTDLLAMEGMTGFLKEWILFALQNKNLKIEIRTKSANFRAIQALCASGDLKYNEVPSNVILAWTLSPQRIIESFEKNTPSLEARLSGLLSAINNGWSVRACFDPVLYVDDWEKLYGDCIDKTFSQIDGSKLLDVSSGVFRLSSEYYKKMSKLRPDSLILSYPYDVVDGTCSYDAKLATHMMSFIRGKLRQYVPDGKIFIQC